MKEIILHNGMVAKVDDEDYEILSHFSWTAHEDHNSGRFYATAWLGGKQRLMHRVITGADSATVVDHKDHDTLNNQKYNLKCCLPPQNANNKPNQKSQYIGVDTHKGKWRSRISIHGKVIDLGYFPTEREAAIAYNTMASRCLGEMASLNTL